MYTIFPYIGGMERMQVQVLVLSGVLMAGLGAFGVLRMLSALTKAVF